MIEKETKPEEAKEVLQPTKRGRKKGGRNKTNIMKAQLRFDEATLEVAETLIAMVKNDTNHLASDIDVPYTIRLAACKLIIDKSLANEKSSEKEIATEKFTEVTSTVPKVFSTAS